MDERETGYIRAGYVLRRHYLADLEDAEKEFDAWLAAHDQEVAEKCARIASSSTTPLPGRGDIDNGSRSQWYANGVNDSAARIRAAYTPSTETDGTAP